MRLPRRFLRVTSWPWLRVSLVPVLGLALTAILLAGCNLLRAPEDPYADVRQCWRENYSVSDQTLATMPFYSITARIDPEHGAYTGTLDLTVPVSRTKPLRDLLFRTYPRLLVFDGDLQLTGAWVDGATVGYVQVSEGTALQLNLVKPLENGTRAQVRLLFHGEFPTDRTADQYTIFGKNEDVLSLTNFYPILAGRRGNDWDLDLPHPQGDVGFHEAALHRVTLTMPPGLTVIATGTEITRTSDAEGWVTARYGLGPAREFTALLSPTLRVMEGEALGTRVRSYYYEADMEAALKSLHDGMAALQIYSDAFGPYPYRDMAIVQAPLTFHGMEFPGVNLIGGQDYNKYLQDLENLVVHEVAHQWWYNMVGSDQLRTPWLDEGLAEFSMYTYYRGRYGAETADNLRALRWEMPLRVVKARGMDRPIGLRVVDYDEYYETLVYGKGALFVATLRDEMGQLRFDQLLREYASRYRWEIATQEEFQALAEEISGQDLDEMFDEWVYATQVADAN